MQIFCHGRIAPDQLRRLGKYPRGGQRGNGDRHVRTRSRTCSPRDMRHLEAALSASGPALTSNAAKAPSLSNLIDRMPP